MNPDGELPVFVLWEKLTLCLFERTEKFPRSVRPTLTVRIENAALDVLEGLVTARFQAGREKLGTLRTLDDRVTRLRVLLRLAAARGHLSTGGYEDLNRQIDEAGRMLGGWRRQVAVSP